jgi:hypothetical protein
LRLKFQRVQHILQLDIRHVGRFALGRSSRGEAPCSLLVVTIATVPKIQRPFPS